MQVICCSSFWCMWWVRGTRQARIFLMQCDEPGVHCRQESSWCNVISQGYTAGKNLLDAMWLPRGTRQARIFLMQCDEPGVHGRQESSWCNMMTQGYTAGKNFLDAMWWARGPWQLSRFCQIIYKNYVLRRFFGPQNFTFFGSGKPCFLALQKNNLLILLLC